jgi:hypothetical protein
MNAYWVFKRLITRAGELDLAGLDVTDEDLAGLPLGEIKEISFMGNPRITIAGLSKLTGGDGVVFLDFLDSEMSIDDSVLKKITTTFPNMKILWLGGGGLSVTPEGLKALAKCQRLIKVLVTDQVLSAALRKLFPNLTVTT